MRCRSIDVFVHIDAGGGNGGADREASQGNSLISFYLFFEYILIHRGPSSKRCEIIHIRIAVELSIGLVTPVDKLNSCFYDDIGALFPEVVCPKFGRRKYHCIETIAFG
jgi:hypothetical protein